MKNKVAILGGTFDPIHNGHIGIAHNIIKQGLVDSVIYLPASTPPHKRNQQITNANLRLKMVKSVVDEKTAVSDFEISHPERISYSEQTMNELRSIYPDDQLYFFMGMDSLCSLHHWRNFIQFIENNQFIVYTRIGDEIPSHALLTSNFNNRPDLADKMLKSITTLPNFDISSSQIRQAVSQREPIDQLVPPSVRKIIENNNLYQNTKN